MTWLLLSVALAAEPIQQGADPLFFAEAESVVVLDHDSWILRGVVYDDFLVKAKNLESCEAQLALSVETCVPGLAKVEHALSRASVQMKEDEALVAQLQADIHHLELRNEQLKNQRNQAAVVAGGMVLGGLAVIAAAALIP